MKLLERGYIYGMQKRVGDWLCEQRGVFKARVHTKGMDVPKRANYHTHAPDEQDLSCSETKAGIKKKARESLDSSHHIVGEGLQVISEGTDTKLPKLDSLKWTIQRERAHMFAALV